MHADELNIAMTEKYGKPVYHYHLHIMALPVVDKEVRWSKRCKDPALVGTVKEVIHLSFPQIRPHPSSGMRSLPAISRIS